MKTIDFQFNNTTIKCITVVAFLLLAHIGQAQKLVFLEIPVKLDVEKGDLNEVVIRVKKDGKDAFTQSGASKMRFKLDYNKKYSLMFTKPGYITKTIEINTNAPQKRIDAGFDAYKIGVKLYKQGEEENEVVYEQPVAKIKYDQTIEEFNFDTDYSKSIITSISLNKEPSDANDSALASLSNKDEMTTIQTQKAKTIEAGISAEKNTTALNSTTKVLAEKKSAVLKSEKKHLLKSERTPAATIKKVPADGTDINHRPLLASSRREEEKITREDVVEKNRIVTRVKVINGSHSTEYSCINYKWGGQFYFKNNTTSINENLFVQWTGIRP